MYLSIFKMHSPAQLQEGMEEMWLFWTDFFLRQKEVYVQSALTCTGGLCHTALYQTCMLPIDFRGNQQENTSIFKQSSVGVIPHSPPITYGDCSHSVWNGWIIIDFPSTAARAWCAHSSPSEQAALAIAYVTFLLKMSQIFLLPQYFPNLSDTNFPAFIVHS